MQFSQRVPPLTRPGAGGACTPANGRSLCNSGPVTQGTVNLAVPDVSANYHLVFNNTVFEYAKTIDTNLSWQWAVPQ